MEALPPSPLWATLHLLARKYRHSPRFHVQLLSPSHSVLFPLTTSLPSALANTHMKRSPTFPLIFPPLLDFQLLSAEPGHSLFSSTTHHCLPCLPPEAPTWSTSPPSLQHSGLQLTRDACSPRAPGERPVPGIASRLSMPSSRLCSSFCAGYFVLLLTKTIAKP